VLTIELGDPIEPRACDDCGSQTQTLVRFVYRDGNAYAIYYVRFSPTHPEHPVKLAVGLGEWSEDSGPDGRQSFALDLRVTESRYEVMVTDAADSPWANASVLGPMLNRAEALAHPRIQEVFHVTDHMVLEDPDLKEHLEKQSRDA